MATPKTGNPRSGPPEQDADLCNIELSSEELAEHWLAEKQAKAQQAKQAEAEQAKAKEAKQAEPRLINFPETDDNIRGPALSRGLEYAFQVTGDPLFKDARDALKSYGLDQELMRSAPDVYADLMGKPEIDWYRLMHQLIKTHKVKLGTGRLVAKAAAALCASRRFPQGQSFEADCQSLQRGYSRWLRDGGSEQQSTLDGDIGRLVWVVPRQGAPLRFGSYHIPAEGVAKPYDLFLRRLFLDGVIMIARHD